ncbi:FtsX-like permease family protein [Corynebacterium poyangense]|uniref:FtsX-like permease family protein n=1 Tax=Corynebacterium poyangense TaxID=2684405 RepID=A0A7H0SQU9_9CORY|nr:ABC transporter permease [Corynebacterium poyangense]QNQ90924.1 FtsX-like permease family protein [Corynebacterium poyangense]
MGSRSVLWKISFRNIGAHKLRLVLTVLAVVLGTAFIAGAMMFTRTLSTAFDSTVASQFDGVDAVLSGQGGVPQEIRQELAQDPQVKSVALEASTTVVLATEDHQAIQTRGQTVSLQPWAESEDVVGLQPQISSGHAPENGEQALINASAAEHYGIKVGDRLLVVDPQQRYDVTISGVTTLSADEGGTSGVNLWLREADYIQRYTDGEHLPQLKVSAADGVSDVDLVQHLASRYPNVKVEQGSVLAERATESITQALQFVNYFLVSFGLVALLVGTFLIANTFSMIVAQRIKEFALLRALGATRRQITRSVVIEAAIVGFFGSILGVLGGIGLVAIIRAVLKAYGMPLPGSSLGITALSVFVPLVIGVVVTIASAWVPARRAGRVEPVEAMRVAEQESATSLWVRSIIGAVLLIFGIIIALVPLGMEDSSTKTRAWMVGAGALSLILGFFLASPAISLPLVPTLGRIIGAPFGAVGKLSATNARRHPRRTATTAFALTLGVALVTAIGAFGDTMKSTVEDMAKSSISADFVLSGPQQGNFPVPQGVSEDIKKIDEIDSVTTLSAVPLRVAGVSSHPMGLSYVISGNPGKLFELSIEDGVADSGDQPGVLIDQDLAHQQGWKVGDKLPITTGVPPMWMASANPTAAGQIVGEVPIIGIYQPTTLLKGPVLNRASVAGIISDQSMQVQMVGVTAQPGVKHEDLRQKLEDTVADYLVVQVMDRDDMADVSAKSIDQMLNILYGLLALAVVIAILGIVNTLTLNVIERRREIGMLRAVGMKRPQVRRMITLEAVQIAIFGAVSGILIGAFLSWCFLKIMAGEGLDTISFPVWEILVMLVASAVVGVAAAIWPARRAASTPPLEAVAE